MVSWDVCVNEYFSVRTVLEIYFFKTDAGGLIYNNASLLMRWYEILTCTVTIIYCCHINILELGERGQVSCINTA